MQKAKQKKRKKEFLDLVFLLILPMVLFTMAVLDDDGVVEAVVEVRYYYYYVHKCTYLEE